MLKLKIIRPSSLLSTLEREITEAQFSMILELLDTNIPYDTFHRLLNEYRERLLKAGEIERKEVTR